MYRNKDSVSNARKIASVTMLTPYWVKARTIKIPRRGDLVIEGLPSDAGEGMLKAEWIIHKPSLRKEKKNFEQEKVVVYFHGGKIRESGYDFIFQHFKKKKK